MMVVEWFLWLIIYSFLGWAYESILCSVQERKLINRGFLNGPICPVYGFGALVSIVFLYQRTDNIFLLFFAGVFLTCTVEYITSVLLEKLFNMRWWDYSDYSFNMQGRICLMGAVVFGVMSVLIVKYIHPFVSKSIGSLPDKILIALGIMIIIVMMLDLYATVQHILLLGKRLKEIQAALDQFIEQHSKRAENLKELLRDKFEGSEYYSEKIKKLLTVKQFQDIRLARAFPRLRSLKYNGAWEKLKATFIR